MSYEEFRKRVDTICNILVGAVPSPAGQIDQITYALIYKFMNDIDDKSAALGGKRTYFTGEYEKYNWHNLMSSQLGAHERLELYRQAIQTMAKNPNLPGLFREIYQNAFLPFNSPNVLNLFLKEIDKFSHDESDDIGDAYEYLLSKTGAQGDVGQFRTPRHIIKFIVEAVNPTKDDSVLDPAVGTAGFLIAAYNHVKSQHDGKDERGNTNEEQSLTADERAKLYKNYHGFDIDPTMVRTARVNMYLHGFTTPDIQNHDTLSSEDHWDKKYDVILANPPFMTPKGGIQPHKKFSISASRAEVLFVDYIASHINPVSGRAGIVVPEGVIFQSGKAYKELRKNLVENSLYAVVSLPAGVFNPYAGVKTSVLLLDKKLAKERDEILFVKIENDGYSLNAQRRPITGDQFPEALELIKKFQASEAIKSALAHTVPRSEIVESGDYNLSGDRYINTILVSQTDWPMIAIGEIASIDNGNAFKSSEYVDSGARIIRITNVQSGKIVDDSPKYIDVGRISEFSKYELFTNDLLMSLTGNVGRVGLIGGELLPALLNQRVARIRPDESKVLKEYLFNVLNTSLFEQAAIGNSSGIAQKNLSTEWLKTYRIPLPPIEIQREIVAELDGYQKIIDAAQTIVKTYKPTIKIDPEWRLSSLGDYVSVNNGQVLTAFDTDGINACVKVGDMNLPDNSNFITTSAHWTDKTLKGIVEVGSVIFPKRGAAIATNKKRLNKIPCYIDNNCMAITVRDAEKLDNYFLYYFMLGFDLSLISNSAGVALINNPDIKGVKIPLPPIEIQRQIVAELEAEQKLVDANKKLIETFQQKIKDKIAEVWGE